MQPATYYLLVHEVDCYALVRIAMFLVAGGTYNFTCLSIVSCTFLYYST
jgi:hypothetical protein